MRAINKAKEEMNTVNEEVYICKVCGKEYKTEKGLLKHIETKHKDGEQHE
jgi:hypothetical protein